MIDPPGQDGQDVQDGQDGQDGYYQVELWTLIIQKNLIIPEYLIRQDKFK